MKNLKRFSICWILLALMLTACHVSTKPRSHGVLDQKLPKDSEGVLWQVPNARIEAGQGQQIFLFGEDFLLFGAVQDQDGSYSTKAAILSGETGEVVVEKDLSVFSMPRVQVCGDKIAVTDWEGGKLQFLDEKLDVTFVHQFPAGSGAIHASQNGEKLYCFSAENGIRVVDVKNGEEEVLLKERAAGLYPSKKCGNTVSFAYTDIKTKMAVSAVIDLNTAEIETLPFPGAFYAVEKSEGIWLAQSYMEDDVYYIGRNASPKTFSVDSPYGIATLLDSPAKILVSAYEPTAVTSMTLYEPDGSFLSACSLDIPGGKLVSAPIWAEQDGGYYFTVTADPGKDILLFWDISVPAMGEPLAFLSAHEEEKPRMVSPYLYEKADAISRRFGVEVLIGEEGDFDTADWKAERVYDDGQIEEALLRLENALASYPDGFMRQLCYGTQTELQFLLGGTVTDTRIPQNATGFVSYIGFAAEEQGRNVVAVDISSPASLEQSLHHEIMHLIDFRLGFDAKIRKNALYSEEKWDSFNPEGFTYPNQKYNLPQSFYNAGDEAYFMDLYAKTAPGEDRARIMEYAMVGADWKFSASPARQEKLKYLSACIRDSFDTSTWPKATKWEETLNRCTP